MNNRGLGGGGSYEISYETYPNRYIYFLLIVNWIGSQTLEIWRESLSKLDLGRIFPWNKNNIHLKKKYSQELRRGKIHLNTNKGMWGNTENCWITHRSQSGLAAQNYNEKNEIHINNQGTSRARKEENTLCTPNCYELPNRIHLDKKQNFLESCAS